MRPTSGKRPWPPRRSAGRLLLSGLAAAAFLGGASCGPGDDPGKRASAVAEMQFSVDPALLGAAVPDSALRMTICPPAGLVAADPGLVRSLAEEARNGARPGDPLAVTPELLFVRPEGGALCRVGRFLFPPSGGLGPAWIDSCRTGLERQVAPATVASDLYRVGRHTVVAQFLVRNEKMVLFRLLCQGPGGGPFLVDYLVPTGEYPGLARGIESSIGSLETW